MPISPSRRLPGQSSLSRGTTGLSTAALWNTGQHRRACGTPAWAVRKPHPDGDRTGNAHWKAPADTARGRGGGAIVSSIDEILAGYDGLQAAQEAFYKDLHSRPELSHEEHRTAQRVADQLQRHGYAVHNGIGGTGVAGVLSNGDGPTVLLRCELDALPVREDTGAPYASTVTARDASGHEVPVDHACGHDMHMSCMVGMAKLMADHRDRWHGTLIPLFQPAEETGEGAQDMVDDGLFRKIPVPDVALAQHVLQGIAGTVATRSGPFMAAADSLKITVHGRGDHAVLELNVRSYSAATRQRMLGAIHRIVRAECQASGSPGDPEFETTFRFPVTVNDPAATDRVAKAFAEHFGDSA